MLHRGVLRVTCIPHTVHSLSVVDKLTWQFIYSHSHTARGGKKKSPNCNDMLFTRRHSVSQLVPNRTSIKVCFTQPHRLGWKYTHSSPAQRRVSRSGGLQMFSVPQQLLELQWSVSPEWQRAEAQRNKNRMEHEVTLKALQSAAPQHAGPADSLWAKIKSKQDRIKWGRW